MSIIRTIGGGREGNGGGLVVSDGGGRQVGWPKCMSPSDVIVACMSCSLLVATYMCSCFVAALIINRMHARSTTDDDDREREWGRERERAHYT